MGTGERGVDREAQFREGIALAVEADARGVEAVNELGADAGGTAGGACCLHGGKVGEEVDVAGQTFGDGRAGRAFGFEFEHVEDLLARGEQPAERVDQRENHAMAVAGEELGAVGVLGGLEIFERPEPESIALARVVAPISGLLLAMVRSSAIHVR